MNSNNIDRMTQTPDTNAPEQPATEPPSLEEYQSLLQQANALTQRLRDIEGQFKNDAAEPKGSTDDAKSELANGQKTNIEDRVALLEGQLTRLQFDDDDEKSNHQSQELPEVPELTQLPTSTYSLLITEPVFSKGCAFGIVTALLSMTCLVMTLIYSFDQGDDKNPWGLPVGVVPIVRGAQFLGKSTAAIRTWTPSGSSPIARSKESLSEFSWRTRFL